LRKVKGFAGSFCFIFYAILDNSKDMKKAMGFRKQNFIKIKEIFKQEVSLIVRTSKTS